MAWNRFRCLSKVTSLSLERPKFCLKAEIGATPYLGEKIFSVVPTLYWKSLEAIFTRAHKHSAPLFQPSLSFLLPPFQQFPIRFPFTASNLYVRLWSPVALERSKSLCKSRTMQQVGEWRWEICARQQTKIIHFLFRSGDTKPRSTFFGQVRQLFANKRGLLFSPASSSSSAYYGRCFL